MRWDLAGYDDHPIPGNAARVEACAEHLAAVAAAIATQVSRLDSIDSAAIWQSDAAAAFNDVVEDLPDKLELVKTRYELTAEALATFHPVLGTERENAEFWIGKAAEAQSEIERAETGIQTMQDWEAQAEQIAEDHNEAYPDDPREPQRWSGEDYYATLQAAETDLSTATGNVQAAVGAFVTAAETAEEAVNRAADDDLENDTGLFAAIRRGAKWIVDNTPLAEIAAVLDIIAGVTGILALAFGWVPVLGQALAAVALVAGVAALVCDVVLAVAGEGSWMDVAIGVVAIATLGVGRAVGGARNAYRARTAATALARPGALAGRSLTNANGVRYYGAAVRSNLLGQTRQFANGPRLGFIPRGADYRRAYRPFRAVRTAFGEVRTGARPDLVEFGLGRTSGFANNARFNAQEYVNTFTGAYGRNAQVLHIVQTGRSLTGLPLSLAPGGDLISLPGSGMESGLDGLSQEGHREAAADYADTITPTPITP